MTKHAWNWFYTNVKKEASCFYGVDIRFIYCGVIITDVYGNKRAEFCGDNFMDLFGDVQMYLARNFKRHKYIIRRHSK